MKNIKVMMVCGMLVGVAAQVSAAEETAGEGTLTGDWGGTRGKLAASGVEAEIVYKFDVVSNASGGIKEGARVLDNLDVVMSLDGEKLLGSQGTTALIHLLNNNGGRPDNDLVGSAQGIDNIEVPHATGKLYQAWIQQNLFDDRLSVLAGLYDINSEFYVTDSSMLFMHSTYGIGTDVAQSGQNGPSIFPFTSPGVRVKVQPAENTYIQAVVLDGVPGDPGDLNGTQVTLHDDDGALVVGEMGYAPEGGKIAVGGWYYTERQPDLMDVDSFGNPRQRRSEGTYIIGERQLYQESEGQGLTAFAHIGAADADVNQFTYAWSTGLVYTGLIPGRDEGRLGLGMAGAHNGSKFKQAVRAAGGQVDSAETEVELTYSDNITPWLAVQPDIQYIVNPGTDPALDNAWVLGTRVTINF